MRFIGLDVHREFCEVAILEEGRVRSAGRIRTRKEELELFAQSLGCGDEVALESTGGAQAIAGILRPAAAARLTGKRRLQAYARLDRDLAAGPAPLAAFANGTIKHLFAPRVGCQFEHPIYGIDLAALCLRDDGGG